MSTFLPDFGESTRWPHRLHDASPRCALKGEERFLMVSLVVPARNEELNLPFLTATFPPGLHELIVADGQSTDDTVGAVRRYYPTVVGNRYGLGVPKLAM